MHSKFEREEKKQLDQTILEKMHQDLRALKDECKNNEDRSFWQDTLNTLRDVKDIFSLTGYMRILPILKSVGNIVVSQWYNPEIVAQLKRQITEKEEELQRFYASLDREPVFELEKRYVQKKRFLSPELQHQIEHALIESRSTEAYMSMALRTFLEKSLLLPIVSKPLLGSNPEKDILALHQKFERDEFFAGFSPEIKKELLGIVENIAWASIAQDTSLITLRQRLFFWGKPSCGKTKSAENLARFLGLPFYKISIRSASELTPSNLEGTPRYHPNVKVGWFVEPLLKKMQDSEETYNNGFLIIDDFHNVLFGSGDSAALAFLLDYLNPEKKKMDHAYFGVPIDIGRLNIIITSNYPIPREEKYAPLRSRVKIIEFPDLEEKTRTRILRENLKALHQYHRLPNWISLEYTEEDHVLIKSTLLNPSIPEIIKDYGPAPKKSLNIFMRLLKNLKDIVIWPFRKSRAPEPNLVEEKRTSDIRYRKEELTRLVTELVSGIRAQAAKEYEKGEALVSTDIDQAEQLLQSAAKKGYIEAAYRLGQFYAYRRENKKSKFYYEKAAENNHPDALQIVNSWANEA